MTPEETLLAEIGGATAEPVLTAEELATCLLRGAVPDSAGNYLSDEAWIPTYDMHRCTAAAWRMKAAKIASDYSITIEGRELNRGQMIDNFLRMAAEHQRLSQPRYIGMSGGSEESWRC